MVEQMFPAHLIGNDQLTYSQRLAGMAWQNKEILNCIKLAANGVNKTAKVFAIFNLKWYGLVGVAVLYYSSLVVLKLHGFLAEIKYNK